MRVILISGKAGHGKDTLAGFIKEYLEARDENVLITHYADLLKYICKTFFGWDGVKDSYGRALLQYVGTDVVRKYDPDFWTRFLSEILRCFSDEWDYVLIPDVRFQNEIDCMENAGFDTLHIRVHNPNKESELSDEQQSHQSETALDTVKPAIWFINRGTLDDLKDSVKELWPILNALFKEKTE